MSKRLLLALFTVLIALGGVLTSPVEAGRDRRDRRDREPVVREWNEDGTAAPGDEVIGRSVLRRSERGLNAWVFLRGLEPGGVYTFWWVVPQDDQDFPGDIFVARGAGTVASRHGTAWVRMRARTGQAGIEGFPPIGDQRFDSLHDPLGATVRVEVAYHGQASDAGGDLTAWLSDFWTGAACPPDTPNPNPTQPHCPVWFAATHLP